LQIFVSGHNQDPQELLDKLAGYLSASMLGEFMDDLAMGRDLTRPALSHPIPSHPIPCKRSRPARRARQWRPAPACRCRRLSEAPRPRIGDVLTDSNPKLNKGAAIARAVIHHTLPGRALAAAINPGNGATVAPRAYLPTLAARCEALGLTDKGAPP
jgi:hypothetical protein